MPDLLDKRLIFVTGKGGVGKSTVAAALGIAAARRGRRTIVAELTGQDRIARAFGGEDSRLHRGGDRRRPVDDLDRPPARARGVPARCRSGEGDGRPAVGQSRVPVLRGGDAGNARAGDHGQGVGARAARAPHEGRDALRPRDRRRARDRPWCRHAARARGRSPRSPAWGRSPTRDGAIHETVANPRHTGVVAVALPEEMPVNETLDAGRDAGARAGDGAGPHRRQRRLPGALRPPPPRRDGARAGDGGHVARAGRAARGAVRARPRQAVSASSWRGSRRRRAASRRGCPSCSSPSSGRTSSSPSRTCWRRRACERRRAAGRQARLHLRRVRRRGQDDDLGGDRHGDGGRRAQGRGGDHRPGQAAGQLARARGAGQRAAARRPGRVRGARGSR